VTGSEISRGRIAGLKTEELAALQYFSRNAGLPLFVEADGARQRPLKSPAAHEPVIPSPIDGVLVLAGLSGLHQPLKDTWVHRPHRFSELSGLELNTKVTVGGLAKVMLSPQGGLKRIPEGSQRIALLTQANTSQLKSLGGTLANLLLPVYDAVFIGGSLAPAFSDDDPARYLEHEIENVRILAAHTPIAGVILAAGGSTRFEGQTKQLLEWQGVPLVRHVARLAIESGLSPVLIITGSDSTAVAAALKGLPVEIVHNPAWDQGQSTSIRSAVQHLKSRAGAAVYMLVDQPQIPVTLIRTLVDTHRSTLAPVVAPLIDGERGNPVLFDQKTFLELAALTGDVGGRAVFSRYPVTWVPWHDGRMRLDIDTKSDYLKLVAEMGLEPPAGGFLNQNEG
jgi:molybdenum cofactor cytidylyltransferase